jgi:membrane protein implicated in regulation of membrane protease activity
LIFGIPTWALWGIAAAALAIGEVFTPGLFFLGPLALAGLSAALVAVFVGGVGALVAFIVGSILCIVLLRPIARRHVRLPAMSRTGTAALVGTRALVLQNVDASGGLVKIGGEEWSARAFLEGEEMHPGQQVEVARIDGATALVLH